MAASVSSLQRQEDFKEQFLTCSICTEPYDNNEHKAKFLPCLHSYCKSCLQQYTIRRSKFNCPNCRIEVTLTDGTINSLPNNFVVENLKEYQDVFNLAVFCGSCDKENQAVGFCQECSCFLCQHCVDNHRAMRPLWHHRLLTMAELQEANYNHMMQQRCKKHPKQDLNLFCKEADCKVQVCASCGLVDHRGHDLVDLTAAIDKIVVDMHKSSSRVHDRNQKLSKKRAEAETMQKTLTADFDKKEKDMQESVEKLHSQIDCRYNNAHTHLKQLYQTKMDQLTENIHSIDSLAAQMTNACEFANKACDISNLTQLLTSQNQIMDRLTELENSHLPDNTSKTIVFTDKHNSALAQMQESLPHMCETGWYIPTSTNAKVDPDQCIIKLRQPSYEGGILTATVQTVDSMGRLIIKGGAEVKASYYWLPIPAKDNNDGTYTFKYSRHFAVYVSINGKPMKGSPFNIY